MDTILIFEISDLILGIRKGGKLIRNGLTAIRLINSFMMEVPIIYKPVH